MPHPDVPQCTCFRLKACNEAREARLDWFHRTASFGSGRLTPRPRALATRAMKSVAKVISVTA